MLNKQKRRDVAIYSLGAKTDLRARPRLRTQLRSVEKAISGEPRLARSRISVESLHDPETGRFRHFSVLVEVPGATAEETNSIQESLHRFADSVDRERLISISVYPA